MCEVLRDRGAVHSPAGRSTRLGQGGAVAGWTGKRLTIDLSSGRTEVEQLPTPLLHAYLGGRGLNSRTLLDAVNPGTDPLGPENVLIVGVGPLNGTLAPGSGRYTITALSPISVLGEDTPCFGDSNSGGFLAPELKCAGYDQVVIKARAESPVYLYIHDEHAEVRPADRAWGLDIPDATAAIRKEVGDLDVQVACIGPAGENLARTACVMTSLHRAAGKCGMGAVFGSKRLKAIAVRGTGSVPVARPRALERLTREAMEALRNDGASQTYAAQGTASLTRLGQNGGRMGTKNYLQTQFDGWQAMTPEAIEKYWVAPKACFGCPLHCSHYFKIPSGPYAGAQGEGPEYCTLTAFGSKCLNGNLESILQANVLCNRLGLDTHNTGATVAWAMECWERGILTSSDTDGLDLTWGNSQTVVELVRRIAHREGAFGGLLAEGAYRAARAVGRGAMACVPHSKGLDPAATDARAAVAWGLGYAVSSRGGDHLRALPTADTFFSKDEALVMFGSEEAVDPRGVKGKGRLVKWSEDHRAVLDAVGLCKFVFRTTLMYPRWVTAFFNAVTGLDWSEDELMRAGERIVNVERLFNLRQGLTRADDTLSARFLREPLPNGPMKGHMLDLEPMLDEYYEARGWDVATGVPSKKKLAELGLGGRDM